MNKTDPPVALLPLLNKFLGYLPGDIHAVAAKAHLLAGFEACKSNKLVNAVWNEDKTALVVSFVGGAQTTMLVEGSRLLTKCTCNLWQPARNCPHVVVVWAALKRVVSPGSLPHIRFNQQMLLDLKRFTDQEPRSQSDSESEARHGKDAELRIMQEVERLRAESFNRQKMMVSASAFRLIIEASRYGDGVTGQIKRGNAAVHGWGTNGVPTDLTRFLATHYYYESTPRYFESFLKLTNGAYPIVFQDVDGHETSLVYCGSESRKASITFDIRGDEISISRTLDNGIQIPNGAVLHGHLLFDPAAGKIQAIADVGAWKIWESVIEELDAVTNCFEFNGSEDEADEYGYDGDDVDERDGSAAISRQLRRLPHAVIAPVSVFNSASVRLLPDMTDDAAQRCFFMRDGIECGLSGRGTPSYLLDIPHGMSSLKVTLNPVGLYGEQTFPFSNAAFWLLNPTQRSKLSVPMKTKKRIRAVLETSFALMDAAKTTARNSIIRSLTNSSDFLKRAVRREAKLLLNHLSDEWNRNMSLLQVGSGGWYCVEDDRQSQVRLVRILFDIFGLEAFCDGVSPAELEVPTAQLLAELPQLALRLQQEGFLLRIGSEPLAESSWQFSLDAARSGMDWFELKPEIRCNGEILSDEEMIGLFNGAGILRRGGKLMLLDNISARVLSLFSETLNNGRKKRKGGVEPVRVPRLQILDWLQLRSHGVTVTLAPEENAILESLLNFNSIPERALPTVLNATLRHYQADAWRWLAFLYDHRFGACLADDMGLGKTLQAITLLAGIMSGEITSVAPRGTAHLVVAPPSLLFNWEAEIARFLPSAKVCLYAGGGRSIEQLSGHDVIVTSYGIIQRDIELLEEVHFDVIVFDETQVVKNLQAATSNAVRRLKGAFTLALTGTPVENHLGEYYAIMDLCLPGLLGTREEFSRGIGRDGAAGTARLIGRTRPFVLRRTKQLIAAELPPKIEMDIHLELTAKQQALYQRTVTEVRSQIQEAYQSHAAAQARIIALTAILRLRQICLDPSLVLSGAGTGSPKLEFLAEQLLELRDEGHSALVFSQFTSYLDIIEHGLKDKGFTCLRLDGSTPLPQRRKQVQAFQESDEPAVFLISLKAGGRGLNLTRATYVYHMDPWWNPAVENQASDRAHRIGQTEQVTITRLIMRHSIEEKMMTLKAQKLKLYKAILEDGADGGGAGLSREDFEFLLG